MVATYTVFGRQVGSHILSMATIGTVVGGVALSTGGKKDKTAEPPISAGSKDEEQFIKEFLQNVQSEEKKGEKAAH
ncbi:3-deoxy-7-phosphoheptulonate synthase [Ascosphaera pollenicola]|nr:3-deoxy-7-phosphoheptulonate synthase [Ascosphaera pollenicola]